MEPPAPAKNPAAPPDPTTASNLQILLGRLRDHWLELIAVTIVAYLSYWVAHFLLRRAFVVFRRKNEGREGAERTLAFLRDLERWLTIAIKVTAIAGGILGSLWVMEIGFVETVNDVKTKIEKRGPPIVVLLFLAFLASRALHFFVDQFGAYLLRTASKSRGQEARLKTITEVLHGAATVLVAVMATLLILESLLENIVTLLASVGFMGIALGFGAQSLVRDLLSGFFILLENQIAVGDGVRINDIWGTVEHIGLRCITLRDSEGIAHIIPNGSIGRVSNATREASRAVVHVGTEYSIDPDRVLEVLSGVARGVADDPRFVGAIAHGFDVTGPEAFEDAVLYRIAAGTQPARQWEVMREVRYRVWKAFAREGIPLKKGPAHSAAGKVD